MYNSLDALCKRFKVSLAERDKHGALIDAQLLAAVYLELRGGKERGLDLAPRVEARPAGRAAQTVASANHGPRPRPLAPRSTEEERAAHEAFIKGTIKSGALWARWGVEGFSKFLQTTRNPKGGTAGPPMPGYTMKPEDADAITAYLKSLP